MGHDPRVRRPRHPARLAPLRCPPRRPPPRGREPLHRPARPRAEECRWVTSEFRMGDVLLFPSMTVHASLHNASQFHMRLSVDFRYQLEGEALTEGCLQPHFQRLSWEEIYAGWRSDEHQTTGVTSTTRSCPSRGSPWWDTRWAPSSPPSRCARSTTTRSGPRRAPPVASRPSRPWTPVGARGGSTPSALALVDWPTAGPRFRHPFPGGRHRPPAGLARALTVHGWSPSSRA